MKPDTRRGFTMLEIVIVVGLAVAVAVGGMLTFSRVKRQEELFSMVVRVVEMLERARNKSIAGENDQTWKVVMGADELRLEDDQGQVKERYKLAEGYRLTGPVGQVRFRRIDGRAEECEENCKLVVEEVEGSLEYEFNILASGAIEY